MTAADLVFPLGELPSELFARVTTESVANTILVAEREALTALATAQSITLTPAQMDAALPDVVYARVWSQVVTGIRMRGSRTQSTGDVTRAWDARDLKALENKVKSLRGAWCASLTALGISDPRCKKWNGFGATPVFASTLPESEDCGC